SAFSQINPTTGTHSASPTIGSGGSMRRPTACGTAWTTPITWLTTSSFCHEFSEVGAAGQGTGLLHAGGILGGQETEDPGPPLREELEAFRSEANAFGLR